MISFNKIRSFCWLLMAAMATGFSSCKKFVELGPPPTQTVLEDVFKADGTATSAILALYSSGNGGLTGLALNFTVLPGLSADDVQINSVNTMYDEFRNNAINANTNTTNDNSLWYAGYMVIKNANNAIVGLTNSTTLTPSVKSQLLGEAKFVRAYVYFYLVNMYGDVPMPLKSDADFVENSLLPRTPAAQVWAQIITDLKDAEAGMATTYQSTLRARANKWTAASLLARAYLYTKDYANAEAAATRVIAAGTYSLPALSGVFVNTSNEIILQLANTTGISTFGANYLAATGGIPNYSLYDTIGKSFEAADLRRTVWDTITTVSGKRYYWIYKYRARTGTGSEYNIALRFAELYLIRGEARAQQNNLSGAKTDIDAIRTRAGLTGLSSTLTQAQMLLAIEQERKVELFGEWGHRWFDLKRTGRADAVIGGQKPTTWQSTDVLYPIPQTQRLANPNLTQNPGY